MGLQLLLWGCDLTVMDQLNSCRAANTVRLLKDLFDTRSEGAVSVLFLVGLRSVSEYVENDGTCTPTHLLKLATSLQQVFGFLLLLL